MPCIKNIKKSIKKIIFIVGIIIGISAGIISAFFAVAQQKKFLTAWISQRVTQVLHRPVNIKQITVGWEARHPVVHLYQVTVTDPIQPKTLLHIAKLSVGIQLWESLWHWQWRLTPLAINDFTLCYDPHWPCLSHATGILTFEPNLFSDQLQITVNQAEMLGNRVDHIIATLSHLATTPLLIITGHSHTDISHALRFLQATPLRVAQKTRDLVATGPLSLNLKLTIPLDHKKNNSISDGQIILHQVQLPHWHTVLNGTFSFHQDNFTVSHMRAVLFGIPVTVKSNQSKLNIFYKNHLAARVKFGKWGYNIAVKTPQIAGILFIPADRHKIWRGHFDYVYWRNQKTVAHMIDPRDLPAVDLTINQLRYDKRSIGKISIQTAATPMGMKLTALHITQSFLQIAAQGGWEIVRGQSYIKLSGTGLSPDLGALLREWHLTEVLVGGRGQANFDLTWDHVLAGDIQFQFRNGRVIHLSPHAEFELGLGRILNLLSLQSIPLLPVHLIHLTQKGFPFTLFAGDIHLANGDAMIEKTVLEGPAAWVSVTGTLGLVNKTYDASLGVIPNMTSSLPLIIGLTSGPLAGGITWIAEKLFGRQIGKVAKVNYHITGSWEKPSIVKLHNQSKKAHE